MGTDRAPPRTAGMNNRRNLLGILKQKKAESPKKLLEKLNVSQLTSPFSDSFLNHKNTERHLSITPTKPMNLKRILSPSDVTSRNSNLQIIV